MSDRFDAVAYRAEFATQADTWTTVSIPFTAFEPIFHGRRVPGAPELQPGRIVQIGFLIADHQAGPFRLAIDWVRAYESGSTDVKE
jgi:monofunctional biosynthetic peptidoglycan transglycosylase